MDWLIRKLEDWLLPVRLYFGHKYMYDENRIIVKIWPGRLVKGPVPESDYEALVYVANQTKVPAPKVHRIYRRNSGLYVEREFVKGVLLNTIWNSLSNDEKRQHIEEIWTQLEELRFHTPPASLGPIAVASIAGGPVKDGALSLDPIDPYSSLVDFDESLRTNPNELAFPTGWNTNEDMRRIVLTNGDISPRNIVVRQKGQPSSICMFDWETSGWWPAYWERVKWHFCDFPPGEMEGFVQMLDEVSGMSSSR
jgi:hypothetical protein